MATRFCGICGTEVDEDAAFCPSCGNPLNLSQDRPSEIPPAPAWPEPEPVDVAASDFTDEPEPVDQTAEPADEPVATRPSTPDPQAEPIVESEPMRRPEPYPPAAEPEATRPQFSPSQAAARPAAAPPAAAPPPPPAAGGGRRPAAENIEMPFTLPVMLSGWLIGVGSLVAALSLLLDFRTFANPVTLIVFLLLLAVAATVFLSSNIPDFANRRLWVLVVVVAAFGIGLWRVGLGASFAGVVFFLASLAAAVGAILVELGQDRPMGGPVG
jgi:hypothetical protein